MAATGAVLAASLRKTALGAHSGERSDVRFLFGTEMGSEYQKPSDKAYEVWKPLPISIEQSATHGLGRHLVSQSAIFPRLHCDPEEVKSKVVPHLNEVLEACKMADEASSGVITDEELLAAVKGTGLFLSTAEGDQLLSMAPRDAASSRVQYHALVDVLLGKAHKTKSLATPGRGVPSSVEWPDEAQEFAVTLRCRPDASAFVFPGQKMKAWARQATIYCRQEPDAEKVHAMLRTHLLDDLVIRPPSTDLSFRRWLADHSSLSLTVSRGQQPGPIPPEVYDVLDQVIFDAFGLPRATSAVQVATTMGASLRRQLGAA